MKKLFLILLGLTSLSACGFKPLYVEQNEDSYWYNSNTSIVDDMEQIKIEPIAERFGQETRNFLIDLLTPKGQPRKPKYRLFAELTEMSVTQQAMRGDITATNERVKYKVSYRLMQDGKELLQGNSEAHVSYDILTSPYSTTMAKKKTQTDAARIIADDISLRIGAYFHMTHSRAEK